MRIKNIKPRQLIVFSLDDKIQQSQNKKEIELGDKAVNYSSHPAALREQILAIQNLKRELGIKNLAASDLGFWASTRRDAAYELGRKSDPTWDDFDILENAIGQERDSGAIEAETWAIVEVIKRLGYLKSPIPQLSISPLMKTANDSSPFTYSQDNKTARVSAAVALRVVLEKFGDSLNDEAEIIRLLLNAPTKDVREQGARAALATYKHSWRKNIASTELISALRNERDDQVRGIVSAAIAHAAPESILEGHQVARSSNTFRPLSLLSDGILAVKMNIAEGVANVIAAQSRNGFYYKDFSEVTYLSTQNKLDCLEYLLTNLEQLYSMDHLTTQEKKLLFNCCVGLSFSLSDEAIASVRSSGRLAEFERQINRFAEIDLVKFIEAIIPIRFDEGTTRWENRDLWNECSSIVDRILSTRGCTYEQPLLHYVEVKKKLSEVAGSSEDTATKISNAIEKVDGAVEDYIANTQPKKIQWGNYQEFNIVFSSILDLLRSFQAENRELVIFNFTKYSSSSSRTSASELVESQNYSSSLAILNLIEALQINGLYLSELGTVSLKEALNDENKTKLDAILKDTAYLRGPSKRLFLSPSNANPQGKALIIQRGRTKSFKDYFGMKDLKRVGIEVATGRLVNPLLTNGLLLSGPPGTGKSVFAEVLANELALPMEPLKGDGDEIKEENGTVFIFKGDTKYRFEDYFKTLKDRGAIVLLIDEVEDIASPKEAKVASALLRCLEGLQRSPVIVIATTNHPDVKTDRMIIDKDGTCKELDGILAKHVNPYFFHVLKPCYLFHEKIVGSQFTNEYLGYLLQVGRIEGKINLELAAMLAKGLAPGDIISSLASVSKGVLSPKTVMDEIKGLKLEIDETIESRENLIRTKVEDLVSSGSHTLEGQIDYLELAIITEDLSNKSIIQILNNAPPLLSQSVLLKLFSDAVKDK